MDDEKLLNKEEIQNQFLKLTTKMASSKNLRAFLSGVQMHLNAKGFMVSVFANAQTFRGGQLIPSFRVDLE